ncbi:MAG TPA: MotA/TolQ/ExbB proton channel family protein [Firmicutes bacterium]|nr:MotA/TolQ/ExbB proton channel family protein [Bacillota bacterium]
MFATLVKGGPVMIPILICSILGLAVILDRIWFFWRTRSNGDDFLEKLRGPLSEGKNLEAMQLARQERGPVAALIATGVAYADKDADELRVHMEQSARNEIFRMERGLALLSAVVTISPLLGLLGTVTGLIKSFRVLSALQGLEGPSAMSTGIAEALITTAAGLIVAIPCLAFHEWFGSIIDRRVQQMNRWGTKLIDIIIDSRGEK